MPDETRTDSVSASVADHLAAGRWKVQAIANRHALDSAAELFRAFEIEPTDQTVIIVCERNKDGF